MNILEEIAAKTTERIRKEKEAIPLSTLRSAAEKRRTGAPEFLFEKALKKARRLLYLRGQKGLSFQRNHR